MYPHRIRLRGPWQATALAAADGLPPAPTTMRLPCRFDEAGWSGFRGRARLTRGFGLPRRLDDFERVWLTFAGMTGTADVGLNGVLLGRWAAAPFEIEVTRRLQIRNELAVELESFAAGGGLWDEVALEIRCRAWLRNVTAGAEGGGVRVCGQIVGTSDGPLDLDVVLGRHPAAHATVTPTETGTPFDLTTEPIADRPAVVRVELLSGAVAWFTIDVPIDSSSSARASCPS